MREANGVRARTRTERFFLPRLIPKIIQNGQAVPEIFKYVFHEVLNRYHKMSSGEEVTGYDLHSNELLMWPQAALLLYA